MRPAVSPIVVEDLEQQLKQSLRKVEPNPDFITHLQDRLTDPSLPSVEKRQSLGRGLLLLVVSFLSGILLLWLMRQFRTAAIS